MYQMKPSRASEVVLPIEIVTLERLKTKDGSPLRVSCGSVDESELILTLGLPGARPQTADRRSREVKELEARQFVKLAIEAGTALLDDDGSEIRPAFYFGKTVPHPKSIPGRLLTGAEMQLLAATIFRLGGYVGGQADKAEFFRDGEGTAAGGGAVEVLQGGGEDAAAGAAGS